MPVNFQPGIYIIVQMDLGVFGHLAVEQRIFERILPALRPSGSAAPAGGRSRSTSPCLPECIVSVQA